MAEPPYEQWLRDLCKRLGGFEPDIAALADSPDSLIGMVAAGRGVFVGPEVGTVSYTHLTLPTICSV